MVELDTVVEIGFVLLVDTVDTTNSIGPFEFTRRRKILLDTDLCDILHAFEEVFLAFEFGSVPAA
jgi:hypothetical protein